MKIGETEIVFEYVSTRLDADFSSKKNLIMLYIEEIGNRIIHYCNISKVPKALNWIWSSMVIDVLRVEHPNMKEIVNSMPSAGQKVSIGDTSVAPASSSGNNKQTTNTNKSVIDKVVLNYKYDLHHYRKMRW